MLKSYEAIYDHGRVEWTGAAPSCTHARVLVVLDESAEEAPPAEETGRTNGDRLVELIKGWGPTFGAKVMKTFGDPVEWQREQRRERPLPGREDA